MIVDHFLTLPDPALAKTWGSIFQSAKFVTSGAKIATLPPALHPEIAFVGRSNAGKSTAINTLCQQKRLAFASKTPGRTQLINFFDLFFRKEAVATLADLPGYGYTEMPIAARAHWDELLGHYISKRETLMGLVIVMDARRPLQDSDIEMMAWALGYFRPIHCLLTKADKLTQTERGQAKLHVNRTLQTLLPEIMPNEPEAVPPTVSAQFFSATKLTGVDQLVWQLGQWAHLPKETRVQTI